MAFNKCAWRVPVVGTKFIWTVHSRTESIGIVSYSLK